MGISFQATFKYIIVLLAVEIVRGHGGQNEKTPGVRRQVSLSLLKLSGDPADWPDGGHVSG